MKVTCDGQERNQMACKSTEACGTLTYDWGWCSAIWKETCVRKGFVMMCAYLKNFNNFWILAWVIQIRKEAQPKLNINTRFEFNQNKIKLITSWNTVIFRRHINKKMLYLHIQLARKKYQTLPEFLKIVSNSFLCVSYLFRSFFTCSNEVFVISLSNE